jgi:hypothetical protein
MPRFSKENKEKLRDPNTATLKALRMLNRISLPLPSTSESPGSA